MIASGDFNHMKCSIVTRDFKPQSNQVSLRKQILAGRRGALSLGPGKKTLVLTVPSRMGCGQEAA